MMLDGSQELQYCLYRSYWASHRQGNPVFADQHLAKAKEHFAKLSPEEQKMVNCFFVRLDD
jgi:hypothetical protein